MSASDVEYGGRHLPNPRECRVYWRKRDDARNSAPRRNRKERGRAHREQQRHALSLSRKDRPMIDYRLEGAPTKDERRFWRLIADAELIRHQAFEWQLEREYLHRRAVVDDRRRKRHEAEQRRIRALWAEASDDPENARNYHGHALVQIDRAGIPLLPCLVLIVISYLPNRR